LGFADETHHPKAPSLKLINVPSYNSAKNQRFFLSRLAGSRALSSEDITTIKQKILTGFFQIFSFRKNTRAFRVA